VAKAGYTHIEPVILLDDKGPLSEKFTGLLWSVDEVPGFKKAMDARGLQLLSAHMFSVDVGSRMAQMKILAGYGVAAFVFGLPHGVGADMRPYAQTLEAIAQELDALGCQAWLHNAQGAFAGAEGSSAFEKVVAYAPSLKSQIDTGWAMYDGRDVNTLLKKPETRLACLHFKDMAVNFTSKTGNDIFAVLGEGVTDVAGVMKAAGNVPVIVDQDVSKGDFIEDLIRSCEVIKLAEKKNNPYARNESSILEIYNIETGERTALREFDDVIEAPNWSRDGKFLLYNSKGRIYKYILKTDKIELLDTGFATNCNNDHVISADGAQLAVSHMEPGAGGMRSKVYVLPMNGGTPREVTPHSPSFLHGWSPDGTTLAYCAFRDPENGGDIYIIPAAGGNEVQLTHTKGLNDGPEYDPTGEHIWFNSVRTGLMQVWRMDKDGSHQTQMTFDEDYNSWFPHVSPDGKQVVMISYRKADLKPSEHLPGKNVVLRLMPASGGKPVTIVSLYGGQGTINVNSWAPDSKRIAFVSYRAK
jgi:Tol biopolymer transport system component/sugar phosphate isomerase/epimerase